MVIVLTLGEIFYYVLIVISFHKILKLVNIITSFYIYKMILINIIIFLFYIPVFSFINFNGFHYKNGFHYIFSSFLGNTIFIYSIYSLLGFSIDLNAKMITHRKYSKKLPLDDLSFYFWRYVIKHQELVFNRKQIDLKDFSLGFILLFPYLDLLFWKDILILFLCYSTPFIIGILLNFSLVLDINNLKSNRSSGKS